MEPIDAACALNDCIIAIGLRSGTLNYFELDLIEEEAIKPYLIPGTIRMNKLMSFNKGNYFLKIQKNHRLELYSGTSKDTQDNKIQELQTPHQEQISGMVKIRDMLFTCGHDGKIVSYKFVYNQQ